MCMLASDAEILLHVLDAGHEGYSGDDGLLDSALQYGFVITCLLNGRHKPPHSGPHTPLRVFFFSRGGVALIVTVAVVILIWYVTTEQL